MAQKGPVEFKGKLNGLYLNLDPNERFDAIMAHLTQLLTDRATFYQGSRIVGIKGQSLNYKQKAAIEALIGDTFGIEVESLETPLESEKKVIPPKEEMPIETQPQPQAQPEVAPPLQKENRQSDTHFFFGTMRSGKSIHYPGHVVVIGDVNPGAEIVAEGNIIVMGRVLGFIHAGSAGNDQAVVIGSLLKPTQIRIAKYISVPPSDDETIHTTVPERAIVSNGVIKIEKCH